MKLCRPALFVAATLLVAVLPSSAASPPKTNPQGKSKDAARVVDEGSFGIYVRGRRVATEKFQVQQRPEMSIVSSELRLEDGKPSQTSELQIAPNGDLLRYTWREVGGNKAQAVVEPSSQFLVEHITLSADGKTEDQPFLLPASTVILDDYFFSHRQILAWRYLAGGCAPKDGKLACNLGRTQYGVLIPQQRLSMPVTLEFVGREKVTIRGAHRELNRLDLKAEGLEWSLWLDDNNKMVRILVPADETEVVRD